MPATRQTCRRRRVRRSQAGVQLVVQITNTGATGCLLTRIGTMHVIAMKRKEDQKSGRTGIQSPGQWKWHLHTIPSSLLVTGIPCDHLILFLTGFPPRLQQSSSGFPPSEGLQVRPRHPVFSRNAVHGHLSLCVACEEADTVTAAGFVSASAAAPEPSCRSSDLRHMCVSLTRRSQSLPGIVCRCRHEQTSHMLSIFLWNAFH